MSVACSRWIFVILVCNCLIPKSLGSIVNITFFPIELKQIIEETNHKVNCTITFDHAPSNKYLSVQIANEDIAKVISGSKNPTIENNKEQVIEFEVQAHFLGRTTLSLFLEDECRENLEECHRESLSPETYRISVIRAPRWIDDLFIGVIAIFVCVANIGYGCTISLKLIKDILKRPIPPLIGFVAQFIFMPLTAFGLSQVPWFNLNNYYQLGLFTNGCSPGGGGSNNWTLLLGGNVNLSITMTFVSSLAALAMMPLWLYTLGSYFTVDDISIPYSNLMITLASITVPIGIGLLIKHYKPRIAKVIRKWFRLFILIFVIFLFTFGIWANQYIFESFTWGIVFAGMCLPFLGFIFGMLFALIFRQPKKNVIAISIETGIQNTGISILVMKYSFPQPEADLGAVIPVAVSTLTPVPLLLALICSTLYKKCCASPEPQPLDDNNGDIHQLENEDGPEMSSAMTGLKEENLSTQNGLLQSPKVLIADVEEEDDSAVNCPCIVDRKSDEHDSRCPYLVP